MKIVWSDEAILDTEAVFDYLIQVNPKAALDVLSAIHESVTKLTSFPNAGPRIKKSGMRQLTIARYGYVVVYRVSSDHVEIANVYHGKEDWLSEFE